MNATKVLIYGFCVLTLPIDSNAIPVSTGINVTQSDGYYFSSVTSPLTDSSYIWLGQYGESPDVIDVFYEGAPISSEIGYSATFDYGDFTLTGSASGQARANLEFLTYLIPNSGGEFVFAGFGEAVSGAVENGGCTYIDNQPFCYFVGPATSNAQSLYSMVFELTSPHQYTFTGSTESVAELVLRDIAATQYIASFSSTMSGGDGGAYSGILQPGEYVLYGFANAIASTAGLVGEGVTDAAADSYGRFNYSLSLTPTAVPVPSAVWLFGSGLLGLVGVVKRK